MKQGPKSSVYAHAAQSMLKRRAATAIPQPGKKGTPVRQPGAKGFSRGFGSGSGRKPERF